MLDKAVVATEEYQNARNGSEKGVCQRLFEIFAVVNVSSKNLLSRWPQMSYLIISKEAVPYFESTDKDKEIL